MKHYRFLLLTLLLLLLAGCSNDSTATPPHYTYTDTIAAGRVAVEKALAASPGSTMSVALVSGDDVVWSETFAAAPTVGVPVKVVAKPTADTVYCIGSVTKVITAVAVMKLVDQGRVKLDEPLVTYLPNFTMLSPEYRDITVRMLLNHSSGFAGTDGRNGFTTTPIAGYAEQVQATLAGERLKHKPGYLNVYCNDGFTMVENLVKAVTGQSYPAFVRQEILVPLGMTNSRFALQAADLAAGSYAESRVGGELLTPEFVNIYASGGLYSTPNDMARLAMMLLNGGALGTARILSPTAVALMAVDQTRGTFNPMPEDFLRYGLGWDSVSAAGLKAVGVKGWYKNGGTLAYTTQFFVLPEERLALTLLTDNAAGGQSLAIAEEILLRALVERGRLAAMPAALPAAATTTLTPAQADEEAISGLYAASGALFRARFNPDHSLTIDGAAATGEWSAKAANLKLRTDGWYTGDAAPNLSFVPVTGDGRRYLAMRTVYGYGHYAINLLYGEKLYARSPTTAAWQGRVGTTYLPVNVSPDDRALLGDGADPSFSLHALAELPGYLFSPGMEIVDTSVDDTLARSFLLIPQNYGRDLSEIAVVDRGGEAWLRQRSVLLRPVGGIPLLSAGVSAVTITSEGLAEWRKLPPSGALAITGSGLWRVYDATFTQTAAGSGSGSTVLAGNGTEAWLLLFAPSGTELSLNLVP